MATNNSINNEIANNDFAVKRSTAGTSVVSSVSHSDNTNTASHAKLEASVGGTSGGDAFVRFNITSGQDYSFGIDNSDSDSLKIQDDTDPSTGNNLWKMTPSGERTMPLQPSFYAYNSSNAANVTGDGTAYTATFAAEVFDQNADFNTGTYTFTAPVTGIYVFGTKLYTYGNGAAHTSEIIEIITSDNTSNNSTDPAKIFDGGAGVHLNVVTVLPMDAADTAYISLTTSGGAKAVGFGAGAANSYFYGELLC